MAKAKASQNTLTDQDYADAAQDVKAAFAPKAAGPGGAPVGCPCTDEEIVELLEEIVDILHDEQVAPMAAAAPGAPVGKFDWSQLLEIATKLLPIILALFAKKNPTPGPATP